MKKQSAGRRVRREKIRRKKMQVREKVGKSRNTVFFRGFVAPEGWKVGSLKRRVRRHLGRWEMKSCTPFWREARLEVKCVKNWRSRTTFGSCDVEKVHTVVARSTFPSQNVQNTPCRATFGSYDVEKVHAVVTRSTFRSQNVQNTTCSRHFWRIRSRKSARRCGAKHISKSKCTKHQGFGPLLEVQMSLRVASGHYTTLYTPLHYTPQHYNYNYRTTQLHSTTLHYIKLQYATPHYTTLHYTTLHYTTLYTPLHYTTLD